MNEPKIGGFWQACTDLFCVIADAIGDANVDTVQGDDFDLGPFVETDGEVIDDQ